MKTIEESAARAFVVAAKLNHKYGLGEYHRLQSPEDGLVPGKTTCLTHTSKTGRLHWDVALGGSVEIKVTKSSPWSKMEGYLDTTNNILVISTNDTFMHRHVIAMLECAFTASDNPHMMEILVLGEFAKEIEFILLELGYDCFIARSKGGTDSTGRKEAAEQILADRKKSTN